MSKGTLNPGQDAIGLEESLSALVDHPVDAATLASFKKIQDLIDSNKRWYMDMRSELKLIEPFLKTEGVWFKAVDIIAQRHGRDRKTVLRLVKSPTAAKHIGEDRDGPEGDHKANPTSFLSQKTEQNSEKDELMEEAKRRAGRRINFAVKPKLML